jgi:hypothetical protein
MRSANLNLATGELLVTARHSIDPVDDDELMAERYGDVSPPGPDLDFFESAEQWMVFAMRTLSLDKYHNVVMILRGPNGGQIESTVAADRQGYFLFMRAMADEVMRHGHTQVLVINEAWVAPFREDVTGIQRARDTPDRQEALTLWVATADRRSKQLSAIFHRDADESIVFDPVETSTAGQPWALEPILNAWGFSARDLCAPSRDAEEGTSS